MPTTVPQTLSVGRSVELATHDVLGCQLWAWDTDRDGLCRGNNIPQLNVNNIETAGLLLTGGPATTFTLSVSDIVSQSGAPQLPDIEIQLLAGHGQAASRVMHVMWTPSLNSQAWIFQYSGRLAASWYLFFNTAGGNASNYVRMSIRCLLARVPATASELGVNVVTVP